MKYLIWFLFIVTITSILIGLIVDLSYSEQLVGFGVIGLCVIVFPLFSYFRWKDKKIADYMLTPENLEKMREFNDSKEP
jgi:hypothetical protein|tara:strand:+ start:13 stop:249 length:237 start_codon:yes stop_codon:yes gene_type:complete